MPLVLISGHIHDDGMAVFAARPDVKILEMEERTTASFFRELPDADALADPHRAPAGRSDRRSPTG